MESFRKILKTISLYKESIDYYCRFRPLKKISISWHCPINVVIAETASSTYNEVIIFTVREKGKNTEQIFKD